jgi:type II secretory pathway pseudopilin PulG
MVRATTRSGDVAMVETTVDPGRAKEPPIAEAGYNLVIVLILVMFVNIALAVAMPKWSEVMQREKEEELIHRGMQYAEAIRVFQVRFGRPPTKLEELMEMEPRSIRQLYPNPMTEDGAWGILLQGAGGGAGNQAGRRPRAPGGPGDQRRPDQRGQEAGDAIQNQGRGGGRDSGGPGQGQPNTGQRPGSGGVIAVAPTKERDVFGRRREQGTTGPIVGVWAGVDGESKRVFFGKSDYKEWYFTVDLIPMPAVMGAEGPLPRVTDAWVGKPWREGLEGAVQQSRTRSGQPAGQDLTGAQGPGASRLGGQAGRNRQGAGRQRPDRLQRRPPGN